ncbi:MAG: phosphoribosylglycinamide formyltransferase [Nitrospirae bacterium]|nr:MAG: phosphoribosylglycinamide formyltransferase [Nitrospirota bacterium]
MKPVNLGVLISGRGSNLQAIHEAIGSRMLDAAIRVVISNKEHAPGLERARGQGLNGIFLDPKRFASASHPREEYDRAIVQLLREAHVDLVVLAGYMRIVTPILIHAYPWRIMNIHPSLLPAFPGLNAQQQALEWGVKVSGCTVHFVTEGVDEGPIIRQAAVPVLEGDTVDSLSARILEQEHRILPEAIQLFAENRLRVEGRRVRVRESG